MATMNPAVSTPVPIQATTTTTNTTTSASDASPLSFLAGNPVVSALQSLNASFTERRAALGLRNPGTVENVSREVQKDVFLNNHTFSGMRADLMKSFSMNPVFQMSHAFTMGAQGLPPYTFAAIFGTDKVCLLRPASSSLSSPSSFPRHICVGCLFFPHLSDDTSPGIHASQCR